MYNIVLDPEIPLSYMKYDYVLLSNLRDYVEQQEKKTHRAKPEDRVGLIVEHSLDLVARRIADARMQFQAAHPAVREFCFEGENKHIDRQLLTRYFLGRMTRREMRDVEEQCRWCPECGWEFVGVGRALTGYGLLFGIDRVLNPIAVRTLHLTSNEVADWLEHRQSREDRRAILKHLKICRRCHDWVRFEAEGIRVGRPIIRIDFSEYVEQMAFLPDAVFFVGGAQYDQVAGLSEPGTGELPGFHGRSA
jgi:hypothetical protein